MNALRTGVLLAALTALFVAVGGAIGGQQGMIIALLVAAAMNLLAYWNSDQLVLRMHGAKLVDPRNGPELYAMVGELAQRADVPMPKIYFIDTAQPNAFATGRNPRHAAVAVTRGILESLSRDELAGVLAHELAHIKNRDTLTMAIAATIGSAIGMLANFGLFFGSRNDRGNMLTTLITIFLAPLAAGIVQMAISRTREFSADRDGAAISGRPVALAHALQKIQALAGQRPMRSVQRNPASAPLFIVNPLTGHGVVDLFRTHPRTEERVRRLMAIANQQKQVPLPAGSGPWG